MIKKKILFVFVALLCCVFAGCDDDKAVEVYDVTVASTRYDSGFDSILGRVFYIVKLDEEEHWTLWRYIHGFDYEPGYEYRIRVKEYEVDTEGMMDRSPVEYRLDKVYSKELKTSDLPDHMAEHAYDR